jgi:hypothetical protein
MIDKIFTRIFLIFLTIPVLMNCGNVRRHVENNLAVRYQGDAKLEVGGPFVGVEFHHSCMIPQRISFFYPVANSIDHSRDYWTRDTSFVADWKLKIGDAPVTHIGKQPAEFELTPYSVDFQNKYDDFSVKTAYRFCREKPAMVSTIHITNKSGLSQVFRFDSKLKTALRTCHTFRLIDRAESKIEDHAVYTHFPVADADSAVIFIANAGELPVECQTADASQPPIAQFIYEKKLKPRESLRIVQIIGACRQAESRALVQYLQGNYQAEIDQYNQFVNEYAFQNSVLETGSPETDHSAAYARAVMAANAHYLDGEIVPMPCPAEYNFYFTHDVLVTDLAAVNFDLERVKRDLDYIIRHADENNIIPHAYYWKDGKYVTEYASSDNWNNFWLVQVAAKYYRHSGDREFVEKLYPFIRKSVERSLLTLEKDNLMWSFRPDWWDIGHNYGPRSYMTILAIKSLRDYVFLSFALGKEIEEVQKYADLADGMQAALVEKLWHEDMNYLVNYHNDGSLDEHYYIGSLLAAYYGLLDNEKQTRLVQTATNKMVDPVVGIYNAFPMDFEKWGDFMQFVGNEAGAKYYYFNGGIWPQGNAWYAMALIANAAKEAAAEFIDNTMSLHGVLNGPNGQPAYYEVRNANRDNPVEYGSVDKPQFLWAGAWYLNCLYQLYGVRENDWNIALDPFLEKDQNECEFRLYVNGKSLGISIEGAGNTIREIACDDKPVASAVFPDKIRDIDEIDIKLGKPKSPYLQYTDAILETCKFENGKMKLTLRAFAGHDNNTVVVAPTLPKRIMLAEKLLQSWTTQDEKGYVKIHIHFRHPGTICDLYLEF